MNKLEMCGMCRLIAYHEVKTKLRELEALLCEECFRQYEIKIDAVFGHILKEEE